MQSLNRQKKIQIRTLQVNDKTVLAKIQNKALLVTPFIYEINF